MNSNIKSGFVSIIGRPNVGKSTLLNQILEKKLVIVTPKAQTTRNKIKGIYNTDDLQIVFVDTPGIHTAHHELGEIMNKMAFKAMEGMDAVIWIVDVTKKIDDLDVKIAEELKKTKSPVILVLNKVDLVRNDEDVKAIIKDYQSLYNFAGGITISATENHNIDNLIKMISDKLPIGFPYYPADQLLDCPERFCVAEIIREKVLLLTDEEVPHSVAVTIESFKPNHKNADMFDIHATIVVERPSQKKIIIGSGGQKIKQIGTLARKDIVDFLGNKVYLELFVKVEPNWRNKKNQLNEFGYRA